MGGIYSMEKLKEFKKVPKHLGIIPDGNRRWALKRGLRKEEGYSSGLEPGFRLYEMCLEAGIQEITFYGFTQDNVKRPSVQADAFKKACVDAVMGIAKKDAQLLIMGNSKSKQFPSELLPYTKRVTLGKGLIKVNFLVNYGWSWDLNYKNVTSKDKFQDENFQGIASSDISRIDLILRWGGRRRLSGFLPVQSVYSDFFVIDDLWPDFKPQHFYDALTWYQHQDATLGG
jgi:undecaprenyl diphosphate synthase